MAEGSKERIAAEQSMENAKKAAEEKQKNAKAVRDAIAKSEKEVNDIIEKLKEIDVDGETMEYIINSVGMADQIHRQLVLKNTLELTNQLLKEKEELNNW